MIHLTNGAPGSPPPRPYSESHPMMDVASNSREPAHGPARLRVAHVVLSMDCGGLERVVLDLVREAIAAGFDVSVICLERPGVLGSNATAAGASVSCLFKKPGFRPELFGKLGAIFRERRPDVVHTHQIGALFYAGLASRRAGVPLVVHTEHGKHYNGRWRLRFLARLAGHYAARVFCVSEDIAAEVRSRRIVPGRKIRVVPNGIDLTPFGVRAGDEVRRSLGIPLDAPTIGTVGRLAEIKQQAALIRAFGRVRSGSPRAHLLIVGDGPLRDDLGGLASDLGLEGCVHFAGYQERTAPYMGAMDVFALTSRSEGMPLAVLEAWAAGLPVVATRVGGLPELVEDGRTGLLIEPGDEEALAGALSRLLAEPDTGRRMGDSGRLLVSRAYSLRRMADDYRRNYRELLA